MSKAYTEDRAAVADNEENERSVSAPKGGGRGGDAVSYARSGGAGEGSPLRIYKPGQGSYVRWGSAVAAGVIAVAFAQFLYEQLGRFETGETARFLIPVVALVALAVWIFRLIGQNRRVVDFMVATEAEMRKVHWSSRREVLGATRVVIVVLLGMGLFLFIVDWIFIVFFQSIGVLRVQSLFNMFSSNGG